jgi:chromosome segregation ATPase
MSGINFLKYLIPSGPSKKELAASVKSLQGELTTTKASLDEANAKILDNETAKASTLALIKSGKERYASFVDNIKSIADDEPTIKKALGNFAKGTQTPDDYNSLYKYKKQLREHYKKLIKDPQYYERRDALLRTEMKDFDKEMLGADFAEKFVYAQKGSNPLDAAKKVNEIINAEFLRDLSGQSALKHGKMYPHTGTTRYKVMYKNVDTYKPE